MSKVSLEKCFLKVRSASGKQAILTTNVVIDRKGDEFLSARNPAPDAIVRTLSGTKVNPLHDSDGKVIYVIEDDNEAYYTLGQKREFDWMPKIDFEQHHGKL